MDVGELRGSGDGICRDAERAGSLLGCCNMPSSLNLPRLLDLPIPGSNVRHERCVELEDSCSRIAVSQYCRTTVLKMTVAQTLSVGQKLAESRDSHHETRAVATNSTVPGPGDRCRRQCRCGGTGMVAHGVGVSGLDPGKIIGLG